MIVCNVWLLRSIYIIYATHEPQVLLMNTDEPQVLLMNTELHFVCLAGSAATAKPEMRSAAKTPLVGGSPLDP